MFCVEIMKIGSMVILTFLGLAMVTVALLLAASVFYLISGSLEMYPTPEQHEKVRLTAGGASALFLLVETFLIGAFVMVIRKKKENAAK
ncbi:MAG: hypothetical protein D3909_01010 [Candidatus Electrothrix sp. ATG1]|nr:hypothetical protein [Candidatus Electrothrix sp. ATG1]